MNSLFILVCFLSSIVFSPPLCRAYSRCLWKIRRQMTTNSDFLEPVVLLTGQLQGLPFLLQGDSGALLCSSHSRWITINMLIILWLTCISLLQLGILRGQKLSLTQHIFSGASTGDWHKVGLLEIFVDLMNRCGSKYQEDFNSDVVLVMEIIYWPLLHKRSRTSEWIRKIYIYIYICMCVCACIYICTHVHTHTQVDYYWALKEKEILPCATT